MPHLPFRVSSYLTICTCGFHCLSLSRWKQVSLTGKAQQWMCTHKRHSVLSGEGLWSLSHIPLCHLRERQSSLNTHKLANPYLIRTHKAHPMSAYGVVGLWDSDRRVRLQCNERLSEALYGTDRWTGRLLCPFLSLECAWDAEGLEAL